MNLTVGREPVPPRSRNYLGVAQSPGPASLWDAQGHWWAWLEQAHKGSEQPRRARMISRCPYTWMRWYRTASLSPQAQSKVPVHLQCGTSCSVFPCRKQEHLELRGPAEAQSKARPFLPPTYPQRPSLSLGKAPLPGCHELTLGPRRLQCCFSLM